MRENLRMRDANINRLREGLRVLEDISRFVLQDALLLKQLKGYRHALQEITHPSLLYHRESEQDVGRPVNTGQEFQRDDWMDIMLANAKRVQEALRTLEETTKITDIGDAQVFKDMRYNCYTIEKQLAQKLVPHSRPRLTLPLLYLLLTPETCRNRDALMIADQALQGGVKAIQLRSKALPDKELCKLGKRLKPLCRTHEALFIVNDRGDLALALQADGVHLGQDDLSVTDARKVLEPRQVIGLSCHDQDQLQSEDAKRADYLAIGPIFETQTKKNIAPIVGPTIFEKIQDIHKPIVAIGGITLNNIQSIVEAGCRSVAIVTSITQSDNVLSQTNLLLKKLNGESDYENSTYKS